MKRSIIILIALLFCLCWLPIQATAASLEATLTVDGTASGRYATVQDAVDAVTQLAGSDFVIEIAGGTVSDPLNIAQQPNKSLTIRPQANATVTFTNTITIDGNGNFNSPESLTIAGLYFDMTSGAAANSIYFNLIPPRAGNCYAHNIAIRNCGFKGIQGTTVAVQSVARGINSVSIIDCTAADMHSLAQLKAVSGTALIQGCTVTHSSEGVNFYGTADLVVTSCNFNVNGYAVRSGQSSGVISDAGSVVINNSVLETSSTQDGAIVLRGDSTKNIIVTHAKIMNTSMDGAAIQNTNPASAALYAVTLIDSDLTGDIVGIDASAVTTIDDPNVPSGPVEPVSQSNALLIIIMLLCLIIGVLIVVIASRRWWQLWDS